VPATPNQAVQRIPPDVTPPALASLDPQEPRRLAPSLTLAFGCNKSMLLRSLFALVLVSLTGCSATGWQSRDFAKIIATRGPKAPEPKAAHFLTVLDGVAKILYEDQFLFQTNGSDLRPARVFSQGSLLDRSNKDFTSQTTFVILETPQSSVACVITYSSKKEIWVTFGQERVVSLAQPQLDTDPARILQARRLVDRIRASIARRLPGYEITTSYAQ